MRLQRFRFSGSIGSAKILDIPRLCRDTGPPFKAGFVFLGCELRESRRSPASRNRESCLICRFVSRRERPDCASRCAGTVEGQGRKDRTQRLRGEGLPQSEAKAVSDYEKGEYPPSDNTLARIAKATPMCFSQIVSPSTRWTISVLT